MPVYYLACPTSKRLDEYKSLIIQVINSYIEDYQKQLINPLKHYVRIINNLPPRCISGW